MVFLLNSIKPALDGLMMINKNVYQKEQKKCSKNCSYTLNKCEYEEKSSLFIYIYIYIYIFKLKMFFNKDQ